MKRYRSAWQEIETKAYKLTDQGITLSEEDFIKLQALDPGVCWIIGRFMSKEEMETAIKQSQNANNN